ncbi:MAG: hypothetical protein E7463_06940 [Ruminococcaceae bacterium]|nr:hypothetical protein [Oscillospiraceae bacterium]
MKITAVFDNMEAAEAAAAQVEASMPAAHRRAHSLRASGDDWLPGESPPTEVFYARTNGLVNAGLAASVYPGAFSGGVNPPGLFQGSIPYPYLDLAPDTESHEAPSEEVLLTIEVGSNHIRQAESILINHHGHNIRISESHY